ncbi:MAG: TonB-dependent receptor [Acidobacteria bacterium]|nr:TonB-dependent receptor [Acidobacteriota bacterium]
MNKLHGCVARMWIGVAMIGLAAGVALAADGPGRVSGVVRDSSGAVIANANVALVTGEQMSVKTVRTGKDGQFALEQLTPGRYLLVVSFPGFSDKRVPVTVSATTPRVVDVTLDVTPVEAEVTVTATAGVAQDVQAVSQPINVIESGAILERAKAVVAQAVLEEPGVNLLRTSPTMAGIYVRGLTGNKVNIFVDGVRYSNSAQRGGVNTFLDLIEPSSLQAIEILRGPNSAQYGSDALGGSIQFLSQVPSLLSPGGPAWRGAVTFRANTADESVGTNVSVGYSAERFGMLVNTAVRKMNRLRAGDGINSHAAVTRFLGLSSDKLMAARLPDTEFTQYGGLLKLNWTPSSSDQFVVSYSRNQQDGGKRYDQLLGGDGNLQADLRNLMLDAFYVKYNRAGLGIFDQVTATYSFNTQREERVNQGGNGNPLASITHEYERTYAHGFQVKAVARFGDRHELLVGGEFYPERIKAPSFAFNPVNGATTVRRGRVPDGATYRSEGLYVQDAFEIVPGLLRAVGDLRYSGAHYRSRASDSPIINGKPLWPDDALDTSSVTFRAGLVATPKPGWSFTTNVSRGFRAPHITDLGTLGLTGSGFTVSATELKGLGATIGSGAGATATSTGRTVAAAGPETSLSYEGGFGYRSRRLSTEASFFVNSIYDNITYQALILPQGAVGLTLGDQMISAQGATGVVYVPASSSPVLVRVNYGDARIVGFEHRLDWSVAPGWSVGTVLTLLHAEDPATGLAPNIEGGTPGQDFYLKLRYSAPNGRYWIEPILHVVGEQTRLSTLDLEDRRTGATRTRANIRNFFYNGATARGWVSPGADGVAGTADDVLIVTGETLAQVQNRVLGTADSAPLYTSVHGYTTVAVRGGYRFNSKREITFEFENLTDRNYRGIAWGLDAPGRSLSFAYVTRF